MCINVAFGLVLEELITIPGTFISLFICVAYFMVVLLLTDALLM